MLFVKQLVLHNVFFIIISSKLIRHTLVISNYDVSWPGPEDQKMFRIYQNNVFGHGLFLTCSRFGLVIFRLFFLNVLYFITQNGNFVAVLVTRMQDCTSPYVKEYLIGIQFTWTVQHQTLQQLQCLWYFFVCVRALEIITKWFNKVFSMQYNQATTL